MPGFDFAQARQLLKDFELRRLFIRVLGWDNFGQEINISFNGDTYKLTAIAQKYGLGVFICLPLVGGKIPDYATRRKIETQARKYVHEHLIIYTDQEHTRQVWQWVRREAGRPTTAREFEYYTGQTGELFLQRLQGMVFTLEEEETLAGVIMDATSRVRATFDLERVTRRFYDRFKEEHAAFMKFLKGIPDESMQRWYVSVTLNRLMFVYFIQKKNFLNNNPDYLNDKLIESRFTGPDRYYKDFLCPLFFEGFAKKEHSPEIIRLLGDVPYLNGGIFEKHEIEKTHGKTIEVPDAAFERIFKFFDQYRWHLDERPLRRDDEINPDVLGYIFEKYINQKEMGAYYTKEDITGYISKYTILPWLLDQTRHARKEAFKGEGAVWGYLAADPERYIYPAVQKGCDLPLPPEIAAGVEDVAQRGAWNRSAAAEYALPTETWREVVARRARYAETRQKMAAGEVREVNDLITYNLDAQQFAQDVIENCTDPDLLRAFWKGLREIKVLDPTCGSGAFLFAALNILEPLYEACLDRMRVFLAELEESGEKHRPEKFSDFRDALEQAEHHPNGCYFILKSIIVNNLFGVDIMEEAVEICRLRLFLKLIAQVEGVKDIEPLPDIDFNIRAGNTLVGFASIDEVRQAISSQGQQIRMLYPEEEEMIKRIEEEAQIADRAYQQFQRQQLEKGFVTAEDKAALRERLQRLNDELNRALARTYDIDPDTLDLAPWLKSHKPFHWLVDFYGIMTQGGFDVVIGNPPYLEKNQVQYQANGYETSITGTIHALCIERSTALARYGYISMIVPLAVVSTQRMKIVQNILNQNNAVWYSNYSWRPGKLFDTVNRALTIFIAIKSKEQALFTTHYQKWTSENRALLIQQVNFVKIESDQKSSWIPKLGQPIEQSILTKFLTIPTKLGGLINRSGNNIYYRTTGGLYWKIFTNFSPAFSINGKKGHSSRETYFSVLNRKHINSIIAILSSDLYWWWYTVSSNCRDLNPFDLHNFPIPSSALTSSLLDELGVKYLQDLQLNSSMAKRIQKQTGEAITQSFKVQKSKPIIDEIDRVLAKHYGFTDEELDFIINYDIKYRMGADEDEEG